jgi:putative hydrolase of the HAD superfamily
LQAARRGVFRADKFWFAENARLRISRRTKDEQADLLAAYYAFILKEAGTALSPDSVRQLAARAQQQLVGLEFVLFEDAMPTLRSLRDRGFVTGLLTNAPRQLIAVCRDLGVEALMDHIITSEEVGQDKPGPKIFLAALERTGFTAPQVLYVGDQYEADIVGARGAGIDAVLLDRYDLSPEVSDCPRIRELAEVQQYL